MVSKAAPSSAQRCLVIVESPTKIKSLQKFLKSGGGQQYDIMASYGHVRDLEPKKGAVDPAHDFAMRYQIIDRNQKHVAAIVKAAKKADCIMLATDPDREGEAIAWHISEILSGKNATGNGDMQRVVFNEITKTAVQHAVANPRVLSMDLVQAQQARRALDYLVGFNLSPLLWKKIHRGLSAGRVQSPALRMIVERELEIEQFQKQEYWSVEAKLRHDDQEFVAKLTHFAAEKLKQFSIQDAERASEVKATLEAAAKSGLPVVDVVRKDRKRQPAAPFITSTLQQEAARKLGFSAKRTMRVAQQLYEGIDTGDGASGLITYMRTDSVNLAKEALEDIRTYIASHYGADQHPAQPRVYQTKSKNAQEAHEAIRPTVIGREPSQIRSFLSDEQYKLYLLIWRRTVACQMIPATIAQVAVDLSCGEGNMFRANGSTIKDPGFLQVYEEGQDDARMAKHLPAEQKLLPPLKVGDTAQSDEIAPHQHFTEPPPRYSEASLIKSLEEYGIGRPSTYASIIDTILHREYVTLEEKRFYPTDMGRLVNGFLSEHFARYVDYGFTANLEDQLDHIAQGELDWQRVLEEFWGDFHRQIEDKDQSVTREQVVQQRDLGVDPKTGKPVCVRVGRFGPYVQLGDKADEEKPKFAGLRKDQSMDTIDLPAALKLLELPKTLGQSKAGEEVVVGVGRYGPYVRHGKQFISLGEHDPYVVDMALAEQLIAEHGQTQKKRVIADFSAEGVQILRGPYGPYVTDGKKNARIPKDTDPESLDAAACVALLAKAPAKSFRRRSTAKKKK
jgi:DNA topoisomerase-1